MDTQWEEMRTWLNGLEPVCKDAVRSTAVAILQNEGSEEIGSSDISCQIFNIYQDFKRSGETSILIFCVDRIEEME